MRYDPALIEPKWQHVWDEQKAFEVSGDIEELQKKPKYYVLDMFPYPSGSGLHVGHPEGYTATDVIARMKRMQGFNVLHPMGWDAFGLPAERAAVRDNIHPAVITKQNTDNFRKQIKRLGFSYDWSREINTSSVDFYQWTQWIFLKLYEKGLAYLAEVPVNWCPALGTVLANEEVKDGKYVETGDVVEKRLMRQWMLKITAYADRLLEDLEELDWPEGIKEMQRNWIGRSKGANIKFAFENTSDALEVFTTCPHTIFGATFCVIAPEHPLVSRLMTAEHDATVQAYVEASKEKTEQDRQDETKKKTGVFTGSYVVNPVTKQPIPVWVADYVLMGYGTGAVMAVPAHDERDKEFALQYGLPVQEVMDSDGTMINSEYLNGLSEEDAVEHMIAHLEKEKLGEGTIRYRLRDWLFSRQRYWGEPFPLVYLDDDTVVPLREDMLPVELPHLDAFTPTEDGRPPLARAKSEWLEMTLPDGRKGTREVNTMPQWAGSCWYYLRYLDPHNPSAAFSKQAENYWMPVDLYIGGVEHAVLHLLYARFWHKVLFDCGLVHTKEPFQKLFNQGMILGQSFRDAQGKYYYADDIEKLDGTLVAKSTGRFVNAQIEKMSKSKYNVINPDDVIDEYGADAMRLYELFMGPLEQVKMWQMSGVEGVYRFLQRTWRLVVDEETDKLSSRVQDVQPESTSVLWRSLHKTIRKVEEDTLALRFNTAISQMMIFVNEATASSEPLSRELLKMFVQILAPYAPHLCEELWCRLGERDLVSLATWPSYDPALCIDDTMTMVVQVNGKKREELTVSKSISKEDLESQALAFESVQRCLEGKPVRRVIIVPGRIVNIVV